MKCEICGKEVDISILGRHVRTAHKISSFDYSVLYLNHPETIPFCQCGCGEKVNGWSGIRLGWQRFLLGHNNNVRSELTNQKISQTLYTKYQSHEIEVWNKNKTKENDIRIKKISESLTGKPIPQEVREKISKTVSGLHKNQDIYGKEWRDKISKSGSGKIRSAEIRKKISERQMGKGNSMYGKELSAESRVKRSKSLKIAHRDGRFSYENCGLKNMGKNFPPSRFEIAVYEKLKELDFITEYEIPIIGRGYRYWIDFAYLPKKIAIEIDSGLHNKPANIEKDKIKDQYLKSIGWKVYRISFAKENPEEVAELAYNKAKEVLANEDQINNEIVVFSRS